jgi:hypothetical protein
MVVCRVNGIPVNGWGGGKAERPLLSSEAEKMLYGGGCISTFMRLQPLHERCLERGRA